eukprot:s2571_g8.t1
MSRRGGLLQHARRFAKVATQASAQSTYRAYWPDKSGVVLSGYGRLIKEKAQRSQWLDALVLFDGLRSSTEELSTEVVQQVMAACAKARKWQMALQLFEQLPSWKVVSNMVTYNTISNALLKAGHWQASLALLHQAFCSHFAPTVVTFNSAIAACHRGSQWPLAISLLQRLLEKQLQPTTITCTGVMGACAKGTRWVEAITILSKMIGQADAYPTPDLTAYNAAISACSQSVDAWEFALALAASLPLQPDVFTLSACLTACQRSTQWILALQKLRHFQRMAIEPDQVAYGSAIASCAEGPGWPYALHLADAMTQVHQVYHVTWPACPTATRPAVWLKCRGIAMTGRALQCFGYARADRRDHPYVSESHESHDAFAEFYGYAEAEAPEEVKPMDAFQEWFGYTDDNAVPVSVTMYLPDRDPEPGEKSTGMTSRHERLEVEATEMSLALVKSEIQEKRQQLLLADAAQVEELQHEIHELKLQQARLATALWNLQS